MRMVKKAEMDVVAGSLIGAPDETHEEMWNTIILLSGFTGTSQNSTYSTLTPERIFGMSS